MNAWIRSSRFEEIPTASGFAIGTSESARTTSLSAPPAIARAIIVRTRREPFVMPIILRRAISRGSKGSGLKAEGSGLAIIEVVADDPLRDAARPGAALAFD